MAGPHPRRGRPRARRQRRHAASLGPGRASCGRPATSATAAGCRRPRSSGCARAPSATAPATSFSARNRFPGVVTSVEVDGVMALVEIEAGPAPGHRGDHPRRGRGARARRGRRGDRDGEGDLGDGRARSLSEPRRGRLLLVARAARSARRRLRRRRRADRIARSPASSWSSPPPPRSSPRSPSTPTTAGIDAKQSFAGSDELAAQIRQGVTPDVYAAANTTYPDELYKEGLVEKPDVFATNTLVIAVPEGSDIDSIDDLDRARRHDRDRRRGRPGRRLHARGARRPAGRASARRSSTTSRSQEPDVAGIVGKLTQGAVDAGFVYITDVEAADGALTAIELPADAAARRRLRRRGRRAAPTNPERRAGVHRRPARGRRRRRRCDEAGFGRRRRAEPMRPRGRSRSLAGRRAGARARLPDAADGRDLRRHRARRLIDSLGERGAARRSG